MIDISDGLASELYHLAFQSKVNIKVSNIPLNTTLKDFCKKKKLDPEKFALYGGEDYELLLTGPQKKLSKIKGLIKIGKVINKSSKTERLFDPSKGFKHF